MGAMPAILWLAVPHFLFPAFPHLLHHTLDQCSTPLSDLFQHRLHMASAPAWPDSVGSLARINPMLSHQNQRVRQHVPSATASLPHSTPITKLGAAPAPSASCRIRSYPQRPPETPRLAAFGFLIDQSLRSPLSPHPHPSCALNAKAFGLPFSNVSFRKAAGSLSHFGYIPNLELLSYVKGH